MTVLDLALLCDCMLGGLARWLRALGYPAAFEPHIDDGDLVLRAERSGEVVLSSDRPLFSRRVFAEGRVSGFYVPGQRPIEEQLLFVMRTLQLPVLDPRCMVCGGGLMPIAKERAAPRVPPRTRAAFDDYFECAGCDRIFWFGAHWRHIDEKRERVKATLGHP